MRAKPHVIIRVSMRTGHYLEYDIVWGSMAPLKLIDEMCAHLGLQLSPA